MGNKRSVTLLFFLCLVLLLSHGIAIDTASKSPAMDTASKSPDDNAAATYQKYLELSFGIHPEWGFPFPFIPFPFPIFRLPPFTWPFTHPQPPPHSSPWPFPFPHPPPHSSPSPPSGGGGGKSPPGPPAKHPPGSNA